VTFWSVRSVLRSVHERPFSRGPVFLLGFIRPVFFSTRWVSFVSALHRMFCESPLQKVTGWENSHPLTGVSEGIWVSSFLIGCTNATVCNLFLPVVSELFPTIPGSDCGGILLFRSIEIFHCASSLVGFLLPDSYTGVLRSLGLWMDRGNQNATV
jgi:hypothetical protein